MDFLFILLSVALATLAVRPIIVFINQFGHALPLLIFSKQLVKVYIGKEPRYTDGSGIEIGRLTIYISSNPLLWMYGYCFGKGRTQNIDLNIIAILTGLLLSLAFSFFLFMAVLNSELHGMIKVFAFGLLLSSLTDIGRALFHSSVRGKITNENLDNLDRSDADQLKLYIQAKQMSLQYERAVKLYSSGNANASLKVWDALTENSLSFSPILESAAAVYM
jgi:hypothetical protein